MDDEYCSTHGADRYFDLGATKGMGDAMTRGMVLAFSVWWSEGDNMEWLDSEAENAGPCQAGEGAPSNILDIQPDTSVTFSKIKWGEIGSTYKARDKCKKRSTLKH
jgi:cellulase